MGLCKCPRKRMTNLFCFEHHVNVCEECLVRDHSKCVIKSYLNWLEDSDYDATCPLCHRALVEAECTRLVCYHLFHWSCLNRYASSLPANTAPAGYKCLTCGQGIFPKNVNATPVADALRRQLETVPWGRAGLSLPPLDENGEVTTSLNLSGFNAIEADFNKSAGTRSNDDRRREKNETTISLESHVNKDLARDQTFERQNVGASRETIRRTGDIHEGRHTTASHSQSVDSDHSEIKYKRKRFSDWFHRLVRAYIPRPSANDAKAGLRRLFICVLVILVMLLTFGVFITSVNRTPDSNLEEEDGIIASMDRKRLQGIQAEPSH